MLTRKLSLAALTLIAASSVGAPSASAQDKTVIVYCSALAKWCEVMREAFERKTGIKVQMTVKSTGETLAQIKAEATNPKGDIWWAGTSDPHLEAANLDLTQPYASPLLAKLHPWAKRVHEISKGRSVGIYSGTIGLTWNTEQIKKRGVEPPRCWADLLKPIYKDEIQMSHPGTSGTSYIILATLVQLMGEEKAFEYMKALHRSMNQYPRSGAAPMQNVVRGETLFAVTWTFAAVGEAAGGAPVAAASPCEGTGYEVGSMSILKGARNLEAAKAWYDFVLTPEAQATGAKAVSFQVPSHVDAPLPPGTPKLEDVKLIDYDLVKYADPSTRKRLLERWEKEVLALSK
jgi:iron(III) transport system substrate-binding protein